MFNWLRPVTLADLTANIKQAKVSYIKRALRKHPGLFEKRDRHNRTVVFSMLASRNFSVPEKKYIKCIRLIANVTPASFSGIDNSRQSCQNLADSYWSKEVQAIVTEIIESNGLESTGGNHQGQKPRGRPAEKCAARRRRKVSEDQYHLKENTVVADRKTDVGMKKSKKASMTVMLTYACVAIFASAVIAVFLLTYEKQPLDPWDVKLPTDQEELSELAISHESTVVRERCIRAISDTDILAGLIDQLQDQQLISVAKKELRFHRIVDAQRTQSTRELQKLALYDDLPPVRVAAVSRLSNQTLLKDIFQKDSDASVRKAAIARIVDEAFLMSIIHGDYPVNERAAALIHLDDHDLLNSLALSSSEDYELRMLLVPYVQDSTVLSKLAASDEDGRISQIIFDSTKDLLFLLTLYRTSGVDRGAVSSRILGATRMYVAEARTDDIGLMISALNLTDRKDIAEIFLNCGNEDLEVAAERWAKTKGYDIGVISYGVRVGPRWGSE